MALAVAVLAAAVIGVLSTAGPAGAAWTAPAVLGPTAVDGARPVEAAPRAAIGADGTVVAAWLRQTKADPGYTIAVAIGDDSGRFGPTRVAGKGLRPAVALGADGAGLVVWEGTAGLRVARLPRGASRPSPSQVLVAAPGGRTEDAFALAGVDAGGHGLVVFERGVRGPGGFRTFLRALRVDLATGRRVGPLEDLGELDLPRGATLERGPGGGLAVFTTTRAPDVGETAQPPQLLTWAPGAGAAARTILTGAPAAFAEGVLGAGDDGRLAVAGVDATLRGDVGSAGRPLAATFGGDPLALVRPFAGPSVANPKRTFATVSVPIGGGRAAMVFQRKERPAGFSRRAPVVAATLGADGRTGMISVLSARQASEPQLVAVGDGALAVWDDDGVFGAASRSGGRWHRVRAPRGTVVPFHDFATNRQLVARGTTAVLVWESARDVRLSVRTG